MTWRFNAIVLALALAVGGPGWWLLFDNRHEPATPRPVTIAQLRALAAEIPGAAPTAVAAESVAWRRVPGTLLAAGSGLKRRRTDKMGFVLPIPGKGPLVIDTGMTEAEAHTDGMEGWRPTAAARLNVAIRSASLILLTHEHWDHAGGLVALATDRAVLAHARLLPAQVPPAPLAARLPWPAGVHPVASLDPAHPQAVAPGVVTIPAPSHTPGTQMIFVRLASGHEYLFAGDIASLRANWQEDRARSRLISQYRAMGFPEDRGAVYSWLATIRALKAADPDLVIVPGHDPEAIWDQNDPSGIIYGIDGKGEEPAARRPR